MGQSTKVGDNRQPIKPSKPYEGFPLFPHASGRWAKKIRQKTHFFGRWGNSVNGVVVPVQDTDASAAEALAVFNREWPYLNAGKAVPPPSAETGCKIKDLCNEFLTAKKTRVDTRELSPYSFAEYKRTTDAIVSFFGKDRLVDDLHAGDFESFRAVLAKGCGPVTLKSKINRARVVFKFASDRNLVERTVAYGGAFDRPSAKSIRKADNEVGERLFDRLDILKILDALDGKPVTVTIGDSVKTVTRERSAVMKSMVLLGLNCGFGPTDIATLPRKAVHLSSGWIVFPRAKTEIKRRIPLWPETIAAMREAFEARPAPIDPQDNDLFFITSRGTRYVRMQPSKTPDKFVNINALSRRFEDLLDRLGIVGTKGSGFYWLRHCFETYGGETKDQVAVDSLMGHSDQSMAGQYRERISDDRLKAVVKAVRTWLWPEAAWIESTTKSQ